MFQGECLEALQIPFRKVVNFDVQTTDLGFETISFISSFTEATPEGHAKAYSHSTFDENSRINE